MNISSIKTADPFESILPVANDTLGRIIDDMKAHGYDEAQPIILWNGVVIDGHTRLMAARACSFAEIPVVHKSFASEDEAVEYAIGCQRNRRNLSDDDVLRWVAEMDKRKKAGRPKELASSDANNSGKSAADTAALIGVSASKVERARAVLAHADDETKQAVASGEMSINKAATEVRKKKRLTVEPNIPLAGPEHTGRTDAPPPSKPQAKKFSAAEMIGAEQDVPSLDGVDAAFRETWEAFYKELTKARVNNWRAVPRETARHYTKILADLANF